MNDIQDKPIKLLLSSVVRYLIVFIILGSLFFLTAGTIRYINGWIYLITMSLLLGIGFTFLFIKDKALLKKRLGTSEKDKNQKIFVAISSILIISVYTIPGLDYRYSWSKTSILHIIIGELLLVVGYIMNLHVMLTNSYASRTVEIQEKQKVIDKGLYSVVRHPMYLSMIPIYIGSCFILGSYFALIPTILFIISLGFRVINEEKILMNGLEGYKDYMKKVKYRIIPYIW